LVGGYTSFYAADVPAGGDAMIRVFATLAVIFAFLSLATGGYILYHHDRTIGMVWEQNLLLKEQVEVLQMIQNQVQVLEQRSDIPIDEIAVVSKQGICHPYISGLILKAWDESDQSVPLRVFHALIWAESRCVPGAVNPAGTCYGLGQLSKDTAELWEKGSSVRMISDPELNLKLSLRHMTYLMEKANGNVRKALTMYNWGVQRYKVGITTDEFFRKVRAESNYGME
jgi:hypothetical protein